mmetsp:Transcript_125688/g.268190  ORF Transcript_125688/g.268190 Transcript_125688/m.268190 type:complete len:108 (+) Transcript_125688:75-398(+)
MPVRHVVMFGVKEEATEEQLQTLREGLLSLPQKIEAIKGHELGFDLKLPSGQSHPAGKNRACMWTADFDSEADYEAYAAHAAHIEVINTCIKPIMEPGSRAAIQYKR